MRFSSSLMSLVGGAAFAAAAPQPADAAVQPINARDVKAPRLLNEREMIELDARVANATLEKREFWSFIGWAGRDCTGGLVFAYTDTKLTNCINPGKLAPSISYQNTWPVTPVAYSDTACRNRASQTYVKDLGTNYWCMNGDVRSFAAQRVVDE
ncbi:hypothetical protein B0H63DRAFT_561343 [Podospora didyma]|uniref:Uncharacterized protein n=1 Tax=Podospora didyma TaxID=330526 RepID=A0AAE0NHN1_9PEZI|nr:hypothetical protein B0H63DRAFT_561343 [Podospora didyma]